MAKIYSESIKKWAIAGGISGTGLIGLYFLYLSMIGAITITGYSGDTVCAGTIEDPCYGYINFTANEDIFIYPTDYDPWGRNTPFEFDPNLKDWKLQRSWGTGWRTLPLNQPCTGTWCGLSSSKDTRVFSVAFRKGNNYQIRIVAYKNTPADTIKWSAFDGEIDPVWKGIVNVTLISNTDECFNCKTVFQVCKLADLTDSQADIDFSFYNKKLNAIAQNYNLSVLRNISYDVQITDYSNITKSFKCNSTDFNYTLDPKYACCKWSDKNNTDILFCHEFETGNIATKTIYWTEQIVGGSHTEQRTGLEWRPVTNTQIKNAFKAAPIGTCWKISLEGNLEWGDRVKHVLEFGLKNWTEYTWWDASWLYRKSINITNPASNPVLRVWSTVNMTVENLTSSGKMQSDYDDVRVVYNGTGSNAELNRVISAYNSTHFLLEFATQTNITNGSTTTNGYWMYYGNAAATAPTINKSKVYLYWTDFSTYDFTEVDTNDRIRYDSTLERLNFSIGGNADAYNYILLDAVTRGADILDYELQFKVYYTGDSASGHNAEQFTGFGNTLNDLSAYWNTLEGNWIRVMAGTLKWRTLHTVNPTNVELAGSNFYFNINRYVTMVRLSGLNDFNVSWYDDVDRTVLNDTKGVTSGNTGFKYFFPLNIYVAQTYYVSGWMDDIKLVRRITTNPTFIMGSEQSVISWQLIGIVQDSIGVPIPNATVYIILQDSNTFIANLTTNSTGGWYYTTIFSGNYSICAHNPQNVSQGGDCKPFVLIS